MRRTPLAVMGAIFLSISGGCDQAQRGQGLMGPNPRSIRLSTPDAGFRLSENERAQVRPGFDPDALERLLANVVQIVRPAILKSFLQPPPGQPADVLVQMGDPALQPLLDEVWAPMWDHLPQDAINSESKNFPGRELARQRRAERLKRDSD